jgi:hypothetical protein
MDKSDLNELKNMLSGLVEEIIEEKLDKMTSKHEHKTEKKQKYRRRKQTEKKTTNNGFNIDELGLSAAEKKELAQASKSDRQNNVHVQRERLTQRRPSGRIEVRCRSCGKTEKVSPALVIKDEDGFRYKCNKCSCSPG